MYRTAIQLIFFLSCFLTPKLAKLQVNNDEVKQYIHQVVNWYDKVAMFKQLDSLNNLKGLSSKNNIQIKIYLSKEALRIKKYEFCLKLCYEGIEIAKKNNFDSAHSVFYRILGNESYYTRKLSSAIAFFKKSLAIAKEKNIIELEAASCQSIGGVSMDISLIDTTQKQMLDTADKYLKLAIERSSICGQKCQLSRLMALRLLASLYDLKAEYSKSDKLFNLLELEAAEFKDTMLLATVFVAHANMLFKLGRKKSGTLKTEMALNLMRQFKNRMDGTFILALGYLAKRREEAGKYKEASALKTEIIDLQIDMYKKENQTQINELETQFKVKEIEQEKNLAQANTLAESRKKELLLLLLTIVLLLAALIIVLVFFRNKKKQAEASIKEQQLILTTIIEAEEKERSRIAKDLHDGIVQNLTAIKFNVKSVYKNTDLQLQEKLLGIEKDIDTASKEVREISYQMMPVTLRELGLIKALEELLNRSLHNNNKTFEYNHFGIENRLAEKIETSVYRICQELINNTIKHSKATQVSLLLQIRNNVLQLTYEDNGIGFDAKQIKKGIGLNSLTSRVEMVKGSLEFDATENTGTTAYIKIPL